MRKLLLGCTLAAAVSLLRLTWATPPPPSEEIIVKEEEEPPPDFSVGVASWYGEAFQGKPTASGEPYDMNELTAAHTELPLGTWVQVTNLRNDRTVNLRINDRGPWIPGRMLDVSKAAARSLGFVGAGLTTVRMEVIENPSPRKSRRTPPAEPVIATTATPESQIPEGRVERQ